MVQLPRLRHHWRFGKYRTNVDPWPPAIIHLRIPFLDSEVGETVIGSDEIASQATLHRRPDS